MKSSMLKDAEAGQPLEVNAVGGAVLRAAERAGIDVPVTSRLVADLHARSA
jgi:2-dehydropantoate 2-reductase